jgi:16S rRNA (cytosine1402-N4)-methyltransferase
VPDPEPLHRPVLLAETLEHLRPAPGERVLDCTLGFGGHAAALLERGAEVVGVDRDERARDLARERLKSFGGRLAVLSGTYAEAAERLVDAGERFDGVLADLGVSSMQLDDLERGFSIRSGSRADMRMGDGCDEDVLALIDRLDENALADVIFTYGEERRSRRIAHALKQARARGTCETSAEIAAVVRAVIPGRTERHPAMRTFQALRIAVNDELGQLARLLAVLPDLLRPSGRTVVISFHSLEDRAVKQAFRAHREAGRFADISRRVVTASEAELSANPRASSAKLRWGIAGPSIVTPRVPMSGSGGYDPPTTASGLPPKNREPR